MPTAATPKERQILHIEDRSSVQLNTVKFVRRLEEDAVVLACEGAEVTVEGTDLRVESLDKDTGRVLIVGHVEGLVFSEPKNRENARRSRWGR